MKLRLMLDEGVPDAVGIAMQRFGHIAIFYRDVLLSGQTDDVVCATAIENEAILVAIDRDMKSKPRRYGQRERKARFEDLNLIMLSCDEPLAAKRIEQAATLIEHEWIFASKKKARRMWIDIYAHNIKTNR